jgi:hypothetical protein
MGGVGGRRHAPAALLPGKTRYPLYRRLGGPQSRFGWVRKMWPPPGFDHRTVQPVASHYTDWANPAPMTWNTTKLLWLSFPTAVTEIEDLPMTEINVQLQKHLRSSTQINKLQIFVIFIIWKGMPCPMISMIYLSHYIMTLQFSLSIVTQLFFILCV